MPKNHYRILTLALSLIMMVGCEIRSQVVKQERPKIGLVLGGGGAKGAAEVGVLKVMEAAGIKPDYIAGTSIGSILGALYASGYTPAQLDTLMRSQDWVTLIGDRNTDLKQKIVSEDSTAYYVFGFPIMRKNKHPEANGVGMLRGDHIMELIDSCTNLPDSVNFDELNIPFRCVAYDMQNKKEVVMDRGNLPLAVRASMAIPGAFKPVRLNDMVLLDGGLINNLPVDVVRQMGADIVIAIDLTQHKKETRDISVGIGGLLDWVISRPDLIKYNQNVDSADIYINPILDGYGVTSFNRNSIEVMIDLGETEAWKHYKQLVDLKNGQFKKDDSELEQRHLNPNGDKKRRNP